MNISIYYLFSLYLVLISFTNALHMCLVNLLHKKASVCTTICSCTAAYKVVLNLCSLSLDTIQVCILCALSSSCIRYYNDLQMRSKVWHRCSLSTVFYLACTYRCTFILVVDYSSIILLLHLQAVLCGLLCLRLIITTSTKQ